MHERSATALGSVGLPKRNYGHEKRLKELKRQQKQEEKRQRKRDKAETPSSVAQPSEAPPGPVTEPD